MDGRKAGKFLKNNILIIKEAGCKIQSASLILHSY